MHDLSTLEFNWIDSSGCIIVIALFWIHFHVLQGVLHWVARPSVGVDPLNVEVRLFDKLFLSEVRTHLYVQYTSPWTLGSFYISILSNSLRLNFFCCYWSRILLNLMTGLGIWTCNPRLWYPMHLLSLLKMLSLVTHFSLKGLV